MGSLTFSTLVSVLMSIFILVYNIFRDAVKTKPSIKKMRYIIDLSITKTDQ